MNVHIVQLYLSVTGNFEGEISCNFKNGFSILSSRQCTSSPCKCLRRQFDHYKTTRPIFLQYILSSLRLCIIPFCEKRDDNDGVFQ